MSFSQRSWSTQHSSPSISGPICFLSSGSLAAGAGWALPARRWRRRSRGGSCSWCTAPTFSGGHVPTSQRGRDGLALRSPAHGFECFSLSSRCRRSSAGCWRSGSSSSLLALL
eukprot:Amastigsp_a3862_15.p5 type:complete len:113 gc:universal Amastigsp_a3862_15:649-987(+)